MHVTCAAGPGARASRPPVAKYQLHRPGVPVTIWISVNAPLRASFDAGVRARPPVGSSFCLLPSKACLRVRHTPSTSRQTHLDARQPYQPPFLYPTLRTFF